MLISFDDIVKTHNLSVTGICHVGAHEGQEYAEYRKHFGQVPIFWIEGDPVVCSRLEEAMSMDAVAVCLEAVISDVSGSATFHRANNEQSSSILALGTHATAHPEVVYVGDSVAETTTLDQVWIYYLTHSNHEKYNFLNLDIQGAEGLAIRGGVDYINSDVDYIYAEVNEKELYVGCMLLPDFDELLGGLGFRRSMIEMTHFGWGDAFYVRN